ncbi:MAG: CRISPR-associated helicase Cas3' [Candidatus Bathyarchaeota archaeon]|nr:CRISPR-associated helicase Cas3' [Candidatus Bathyarchaeota archaeon]
MRKALPVLEKLIEEYPITIALLPTGYGKSRFFQYHTRLVEKLGKVVHILPLRAIVSELASDLNTCFHDRVGYQAGLCIESVDKTPFLSRMYTVVTFDSFFMNFYGIPVSELWRSVWHSDMAFMLSRISHSILDEVHLVATPDEIDRANEEFIKITSVLRDLVRWNMKAGLKSVILTATFYPWIFKHILPREANNKAALLLYAPKNHEYTQRIREICGQNVELKLVWNEGDEFFLRFRDYSSKIPTRLHYVSMDEFLSKHLEHGNLGNKVAIMFNSVRRCVEAYRNHRERFSEHGYDVTILHGRMSPYGREKSLKTLKHSERAVLFSTQVVEAGANLDFNDLITEAAPPHALIQRFGRVARHGIQEGQSYSAHIVIGREDLVAGVSELCEGIYDVGLSIATMQYLEGQTISAGELCREVRINWRLPLEDKTLDYLKLLAVSVEPQELATEATNIVSFLDHLTRWRAAATTTLKKTLEDLDKLLRGSFIRSSTLMSIYLGPIVSLIENGEQLNQLVAKYTVTVDVHYLLKHGDEVLELENDKGKRRVKLTLIIDDSRMEVHGGPLLSDLVKYPLSSLHASITKIRKKLKEDEGEMPRVLFLGLKACPHLEFNVDEGYIP